MTGRKAPCGLANRGLRWLLACFDALADDTSNNAGIRALRVADFAGFVNLFGCQSDVCGGRGESILIGNTFWATRCYFTALLRGVVFVGEPDLRLALDQQRVFLGAVSGRDQGMMRNLCLREATSVC